MSVEFSHAHLANDRPIARTGNTALRFVQP